MSALYKMRYQGQAGWGAGVVYIGKSKVLGLDITGGIIDGSYTTQNNYLKGAATLTGMGVPLVTGQTLPMGATVQITLDMPVNFVGAPQTAIVGGQPVQVVFEKIGDIP